jgi:hypothetical protein
MDIVCVRLALQKGNKGTMGEFCVVNHLSEKQFLSSAVCVISLGSPYFLVKRYLVLWTFGTGIQIDIACVRFALEKERKKEKKKKRE